jgi:hypothetical protein
MPTISMLLAVLVAGSSVYAAGEKQTMVFIPGDVTATESTFAKLDGRAFRAFDAAYHDLQSNRFFCEQECAKISLDSYRVVIRPRTGYYWIDFIMKRGANRDPLSVAYCVDSSSLRFICRLRDSG